MASNKTSPTSHVRPTSKPIPKGKVRSHQREVKNTRDDDRAYSKAYKKAYKKSYEKSYKQAKDTKANEAKGQPGYTQKGRTVVKTKTQSASNNQHKFKRGDVVNA